MRRYVMEKLNTYLETSGKSLRQLAKDSGVSAGYMSNLRHGQASPTVKVAHRIAKATRGKVPIKAWIPEGDE